MGRQHHVQHRQGSDESKRNKQHAETRRENEKLRRQVSRLQKQLERAQTSPPEADPEPVAAPKVECPKCGGSTKVVSLPTGSLRVCKVCHWRKKEGDGRIRKTAG